MNNFHPIEVVGRGSETQLQWGDFFNVALNGLTLQMLVTSIATVLCLIQTRICEWQINFKLTRSEYGLL